MPRAGPGSILIVECCTDLCSDQEPALSSALWEGRPVVCLGGYMLSCLPFPALCPPSLAPGREAPEEYGAAVEGGQVSSLPCFPVTSLSGCGLRVDQAPGMAWSPHCHRCVAPLLLFLVPFVVMRLRLGLACESPWCQGQGRSWLGACVGRRGGRPWRVDQPRGSSAPSLFEAGGGRAATKDWFCW